MALTYSTMLPLGTKAPDFTLPDTRSGKTLSLNELKSDVATVIMFICNHCPFVRHIEKALVSFAKEFQAKGVSFVAICANDGVTYPEDTPDLMAENAERLDFSFPYLHDDSQDVARAYQASCTPDFFVFDGDLKCVYRGRFDDSGPGNGAPITGYDLRQALEAILAGRAVSSEQKPSMGCNIKWKE